MLQERMKLANELWAAGIRAQFLSASNPSMTHHFEFANLHRIPWLAILEKTALSTGDIVKVSMLAGEPRLGHRRCSSTGVES